MSNLDAPGLQFSGEFVTNTSTCNNTLQNYVHMPPLELSWNSDRSDLFRLMDCPVGSAMRVDGTLLTRVAGDPIVGVGVTTPQTPHPLIAKILEFDPDQQTITQLYGVDITMAAPMGGKARSREGRSSPKMRDLWFGRVGDLGGAVSKCPPEPARTPLPAAREPGSHARDPRPFRLPP